MYHNIYLAMVKSVQLSAKLKSTPRMATRSQNHGTNDATLIERTEEDENAVVETIRKIVKE